MNILILNWRDIKHPEAGGAEVHLHEIFERLSKKHNVFLITTAFKNSVSFENINGINIYRWGHKFTFNFEAPFLIKRIFAEHSIDCIIDDVNKIPFFTPFWIKNIPSVVFFHHLFGKMIFQLTYLPFALYILLMENLCRFFYRNTPCCTVSKTSRADLIAHGIKKENITIIENCVDTDLYSPDNNIKKEKEMLLYTGRLKNYKNIGLLLDAMSILTKDRPGLKLVIAGSGDDEERLKNKTAELGLENNVEFAGFVSETRKIELYRKASIALNPSFKEGWGITCIEANACQTAVIANNVCGYQDSVIYGKTGLLYTENSLDDLLKSIRLLLDNPEQLRKLEEGGRKWALNFSWDNNALKVEKWLKKVLQKDY